MATHHGKEGVVTAGGTAVEHSHAHSHDGSHHDTGDNSSEDHDHRHFHCHSTETEHMSECSVPALSVNMNDVTISYPALTIFLLSGHRQKLIKPPVKTA